MGVTYQAESANKIEFARISSGIAKAIPRYPGTFDWLLLAVDSTGRWKPAAEFWIIKHGIKSTGTPAWGKSMADPYIWGMVAVL